MGKGYFSMTLVWDYNTRFIFQEYVLIYVVGNLKLLQLL